MEERLDEKLREAVWVCRSLFERGKTAGSSANMSFRHGDRVYITASGTCFGTMKEEDFTWISLDGTAAGERKPSKEWPFIWPSTKSPRRWGR